MIVCVKLSFVYVSLYIKRIFSLSKWKLKDINNEDQYVIILCGALGEYLIHHTVVSICLNNSLPIN